MTSGEEASSFFSRMQMNESDSRVWILLVLALNSSDYPKAYTCVESN